MTVSSVDAAREAVFRQLEQVIDPELGLSIVRLGLVYDLAVAERDVVVTMTLTTCGCPLEQPILRGVAKVIRGLPWVRSVEVRLVWDPPWHAGMIR